jgi:hypothetical protein
VVGVLGSDRLRAVPHRSSVSRVAWSRVSRKTSTDATVNKTGLAGPPMRRLEDEHRVGRCVTGAPDDDDAAPDGDGRCVCER